MTDITLEQRAAFDSWWHKKSPELVSGDWDDDRAIAHAAWEAALRLSAGEDSRDAARYRWLRAVDDNAPLNEAGYPSLTQWKHVVQDRYLGTLLFGEGLDHEVDRAMIAAAPRHEPGE